MTNFYKLLEEFYSYPHTDDLTLDFFNFLQEREPKAWENLNFLYADNYEWDDGGEYYYPRLALHGWDNIAKKDNFWLFLPALQDMWLSLNNADIEKCAYCEEIADLQCEHKIIVSWNFGITLKLKFWRTPFILVRYSN
jgi:hypothetical protein